MKIDIDKNVVTFLPESASEKAKLEQIWNLVIDCNNDAKKLVPIGEYVPLKNDKGASFHIEGLEATTEASFVEIHVDADCKIYCRQCNKLMDLKAGDTIPVCCGKVMEIVD